MATLLKLNSRKERHDTSGFVGSTISVTTHFCNTTILVLLEASMSSSRVAIPSLVSSKEHPLNFCLVISKSRFWLVVA